MVYDTSQKGCFVIDQMNLGIKAHLDGVQVLPRLKFMEITMATTLKRVCTDN